MDRYLIIADDFTGASDAGVQLSRRGIKTLVKLDTDGINDYSASIVLDTESRGLVPDVAYENTLSTVQKIDISRFNYVIKKVDSTIRGNIAEETKAVDEVFNSEVIIFMPAYPDMGRITLGAIHYLNGIRITETDVASDPKNPVVEDNLTSILKRIYKEDIAHISIDQIRSGDLHFRDCRIYVVDAETNLDMQRVMRSVRNRTVLWVGCAGIVDNMLEVLAQTVPAIAIVTSVSEATRQQVKYATNNGTELVLIPLYEMFLVADYCKYIKKALDFLRSGKDVILAPSSSFIKEDILKNDVAGMKAGKNIYETSCYVQQIISTIGKEIIEQQKVSGVFLTGGDTAIGFLMKIGARGSEIIDEVAFGVPMMKICGGSFSGLKIITKAGAFGNVDVISYSLRKLREAKRNKCV